MNSFSEAIRDPTKFFTLFFMEDGYTPELELYMEDQWDPSKYCAVRSMPIAEMMSKTAEDLGQEVLEMTMSAEWQKQYRRPIKQGDILCIGRVPWIYVSTAMWLDHWSTSKNLRYRLAKYPITIVKLEGEKTKEIFN